MYQLLSKMLSITDVEHGEISAKAFHEMVCCILSNYGEVEKEVAVPNRGDGRRGKIDIVFNFNGERIPIEIDRRTPRKKSIFKVKSFNPQSCFVITRTPYKLIEYSSWNN